MYKHKLTDIQRKFLKKIKEELQDNIENNFQVSESISSKAIITSILSDGEYEDKYSELLNLLAEEYRRTKKPKRRFR